MYNVCMESIINAFSLVNTNISIWMLWLRSNQCSYSKLQSFSDLWFETRNIQVSGSNVNTSFSGSYDKLGYFSWEISVFFAPFLFLSVLFSPLWGGWGLAGYDVMSYSCSLDTFTHVIGSPTLSVKPDENTPTQPRWGRLAKLLSVSN